MFLQTAGCQLVHRIDLCSESARFGSSLKVVGGAIGEAVGEAEERRQLVPVTNANTSKFFFFDVQRDKLG